ncbi:hypothetical protein [Chromobacterium sp. IIBBL 290-4]|uniref:hypothetical protein n=1 Tax=Chromobacterium sp. IIBBL 290-4 TaxID=2953890 RepID=UPI0020B69B42|nr:hypothetical protein [Chromobacterium sp. IIBBL 290-4]UTH75612.1 hypothetical protein NKT35_05825 [Chromobacterium sp. IIBBL 290-4]
MSNHSVVLTYSETSHPSYAGRPSPTINLRDITTEEAHDLLRGLVAQGRLSETEYLNILPALLARRLRENLNHTPPERFDLLAGLQTLADNSRSLGRREQAIAQTHALEWLNRYQEEG